MRVHRIFLRGDSERPLDGIILGPMKSAQTEFRIVLTFDRAVWKMSRNYIKVGVLRSDQSHINFLVTKQGWQTHTNEEPKIPLRRRTVQSASANHPSGTSMTIIPQNECTKKMQSSMLAAVESWCWWQTRLEAEHGCVAYEYRTQLEHRCIIMFRKSLCSLEDEIRLIASL